MKSKKARLAEAYELIWEECQLETYLRLHPLDDRPESEKGGANGRETEGEANEGRESTDTSDSSANSSPPVSSDVFACEHDETAIEKGEDDEDDWTDAELSTFFTSLARRSRFFPNLISQDMKYVKSTAQIAKFLTILRSESMKQLSRRKDQDEQLQVSRRSRKARAMQFIKGAHEVSREWLAFEEQMAAKLRGWQVGEDAEIVQGDESVSDLISREVSEEPADNEGSEGERDAAPESNAVDWDTQVLNALLFLRHHSMLSPDINESNCILEQDVSLQHDSPQERCFYFVASVVVSLLKSKETPISYSSFARLHPVSCTTLQRWRSTEEQQESYRRSLVTEILFRGVVLGIIARVSLTEADDGQLPMATILGRGGVGGPLIWLDTVSDEMIRIDAIRHLQRAREAAAHRIINTLRWKEIKAIGVLLRRKDHVPEPHALSSDEKERLQLFLSQSNTLPSTYAERNRLISRIKSRIKRYGLEAALDMPLEPQAVGRKRKSNQEDHLQIAKKARSDQIISSTRVSAEDEDDRNDDMPLTNDLVRFNQAGVSASMIQDLLSEPARLSLDLFDFSVLMDIVHGQSQIMDKDDQVVPADGISQQSLASLFILFKDHLTSMIAASLNLTSSTRSDTKEVTVVHVRLATSYLGDKTLYQDRSYASDDGQTLDNFRTDPPLMYVPTSTQHYNLLLQLQGFKNLSTSRHLFDTEGSVSKDVVISMTDAFTLPISSQFAPRFKNTFDDGTAHIESDSDDSSIYDNSDQEEEILKRRDEKRGADREEKIDGRIWDTNQKRSIQESKRWRKVEEKDRIRAQRHEERLWASVGLKRGRGEAEEQIEENAFSGGPAGCYISLSSDSEETDSDSTSSERSLDDEEERSSEDYDERDLDDEGHLCESE